MVKDVELEEGAVVTYDGQSYLILRNLFFHGDHRFHRYDQLELRILKIECPKCKGNLEKLGRIHGRYKCLKCGQPVYSDENGELMESK